MGRPAAGLPEGWSSSEPVCVPGLSVGTQTLAAAVAPSTGGAGVVGGETTDAAEVTGGQRGWWGHR